MRCTKLTSITVDAGNPNYSSVGGVLFNKLQTELIAYPGGLSGAYVVPAGVTAITASAFRYNTGLTAVTFPVGVASIGDNAFANCTKLVSATFNGHAPTTSTNAFPSAASGFKVYYQSGATGFTTPWYGHTPIMLGSGSSVSTWLTASGLPGDSDLSSDDNHDGVSLLMGYALDLNPNLNLSGAVPQPVFEAGEMRMSFKTGANGVTYRVETCTDFSDWTTTGVSLTDAGQMRTATVLHDGGTRFMRLVVIY